VVQRGDGAGLAFKAVAEAFGGDFDGDFAVQARVVGAVNGAHAAFAEHGEDFVRAEFIARVQIPLDRRGDRFILRYGARHCSFVGIPPVIRAFRK
jgi:hypothetical protein